MDFEVTDDFLKTCKENLELLQTYSTKTKVHAPLTSFTGFEKYEDVWWDQFIGLSRQSFRKYRWKDWGNWKAYYLLNGNIPVLDALNEHLFSHVFKTPEIACWVTFADQDTGSDWHFDDYEEKNTEMDTYLICMNLVGKTHWWFRNPDGELDLHVGDCFWHNGSNEHSIRPHDNMPRITLAAFDRPQNILV